MTFRFSSSRPYRNPYIRLNTRRCKACWSCVDICPQHVLGKIDFYFHHMLGLSGLKNVKDAYDVSKLAQRSHFMQWRKLMTNFR